MATCYSYSGDITQDTPYVLVDVELPQCTDPSYYVLSPATAFSDYLDGSVDSDEGQALPPAALCVLQDGSNFVSIPITLQECQQNSLDVLIDSPSFWTLPGVQSLLSETPDNQAEGFDLAYAGTAWTGGFMAVLLLAGFAYKIKSTKNIIRST